MVDNSTTNQSSIQLPSQKESNLFLSNSIMNESNSDLPHKPTQDIERIKSGTFERKNSEHIFKNIQNNFKLVQNSNQNQLEKQFLPQKNDNTKNIEFGSISDQSINSQVNCTKNNQKLNKCSSTSYFASAKFGNKSQHQKRSSINSYNKRVVELNLNYLSQNKGNEIKIQTIPMSTSNITKKEFDFQNKLGKQSITKGIGQKNQFSNNQRNIAVSLCSSPTNSKNFQNQLLQKEQITSQEIKKKLIIRKTANKLNKSDQFDFSQDNTMIKQRYTMNKCKSQSNSFEKQQEKSKSNSKQKNNAFSQLQYLSTLKSLNPLIHQQKNITQNLKQKQNQNDLKCKQDKLCSPSAISINQALSRISSVNQLNQIKLDIANQRKSTQNNKNSLNLQQQLSARKTGNILKKDKSQEKLTYQNTNCFSQIDDDVDYLTNQEKLWNAIENRQDIDIIQDLLDKKDVEVNAKNVFFEDWTALHYAVHEGYFEVIQLLIESYNANIDERSRQNKTPFHFACRRGDSIIIKYLQEKGANLTVVDRDGCTPLHYLCESENYEMIKLMIPQYKTTCDIKNRFGRKPLDLLNNFDMKKELRRLVSSNSKQRKSSALRSQSRESLRSKNSNLQIKIHNINEDHKGFSQLFSKFALFKQKREFQKEKTNNDVNINEKYKYLLQNKSLKSIGIRSLNSSPNSSQIEKSIPTSRLSATYKQIINNKAKQNNINMKIPSSTKNIKQQIEKKNEQKKETPVKKQIFNYGGQSKVKINLVQNQQNKKLTSNHPSQKRLSSYKSQANLNTSNQNTKLNESKYIKINEITKQIEQVLNKKQKSNEKPQKHLLIELDYDDSQDQQNIPSTNKVSSNIEGTQFFSSQKTGDSSNLHIQNQDSIEQFNDILPQQEQLQEKQHSPKVGPWDFIAHQLLGTGSFGEVYLVEKISTKKYYAMKVLQKAKIMGHNLTRYAMTERNVLSIADHPFIVKLKYAFQTNEKLFLILDYCPGGDLAEYLQIEKRFNEDKTRLYASEILLAIEELHRKDIIFRDLKPDNVVLDEEGHAQLTDFGLSKEGVMQEGTAQSFCGSYAYLAPEMLKKTGHGKAVDWYLLGVIIYEMLCGIPPYYANNKEELFKNIKEATLVLPNYVSNPAQDLIKRLLNRNPKRRFGTLGGAEEIKQHPFFNPIDWNKLYHKEYIPPEPYLKRRFDNFLQIKSNLVSNIGAYEQLRQQAFLDINAINTQQEHISGWSFVSPQKQ